MTRKNLICLLAEMHTHYFPEHIPEVRRYCQIALLEELFGLQTGPTAVYLSTSNGTTKHEHDIAVPMVGSGIAVLFHSSSEFRHRDEYDVFHPIAHIANERRQRG